MLPSRPVEAGRTPQGCQFHAELCPSSKATWKRVTCPLEPALTRAPICPNCWSSAWGTWRAGSSTITSSFFSVIRAIGNAQTRCLFLGSLLQWGCFERPPSPQTEHHTRAAPPIKALNYPPPSPKPQSDFVSKTDTGHYGIPCYVSGITTPVSTYPGPEKGSKVRVRTIKTDLFAKWPQTNRHAPTHVLCRFRDHRRPCQYPVGANTLQKWACAVQRCVTE